MDESKPLCAPRNLALQLPAGCVRAGVPPAARQLPGWRCQLGGRGGAERSVPHLRHVLADLVEARLADIDRSPDLAGAGVTLRPARPQVFPSDHTPKCMDSHRACVAAAPDRCSCKGREDTDLCQLPLRGADVAHALPLPLRVPPHAVAQHPPRAHDPLPPGGGADQLRPRLCVRLAVTHQRRRRHTLPARGPAARGVGRLQPPGRRRRSTLGALAQRARGLLGADHTCAERLSY
jgi:hypothetical protein